MKESYTAPEMLGALETAQNAQALGISSGANVKAIEAIIQAGHDLDAFVASHGAYTPEQADRDWQEFQGRHSVAPVTLEPNFDALHDVAQAWLLSGFGFYDGHHVGTDGFYYDVEPDGSHHVLGHV